LLGLIKGEGKKRGQRHIDKGSGKVKQEKVPLEEKKNDRTRPIPSGKGLLLVEKTGD